MTDASAVAFRDWPDRLGVDLDLALPGELTLSLAFLDWDSRFFGLPCYRLRPHRCHTADGPAPGAALAEAARHFPRCAVWAKVPPNSSPGLTASLQALGGEFIETELTLGHDGRAVETGVADRVRIFKADHLDLPGLLELGRCFSMTRFHTDPRIGPDQADALWTEYLKNFCLSSDRHAFLAQADGAVVGAILAVVNRNGDQGVNVLDFVATASSHVGRGVGKVLMESALSWSIATGRSCTVATQHRNIGAIDFYQKNGFSRLVSATPVFHLWAGFPGGGS